MLFCQSSKAPWVQSYVIIHHGFARTKDQSFLPLVWRHKRCWRLRIIYCRHFLLWRLQFGEYNFIIAEKRVFDSVTLPILQNETSTFHMHMLLENVLSKLKNPRSTHRYPTAKVVKDQSKRSRTILKIGGSQTMRSPGCCSSLSLKVPDRVSIQTFILI